MAKRSAVTVQLIVRRGAARRFQKLKKKTADLPVEVAWDRRESDRRTSSKATHRERRKSDRRQEPPFTWDMSDFVVVERPLHRHKK